MELGNAEVFTALEQVRLHGVRGGAVYDFMHLVAARKVYTVNFSDLRHLPRKGDPEVRCP